MQLHMAILLMGGRLPTSITFMMFRERRQLEWLAESNSHLAN
jgi:hypothetical protein